jgi:hypothetical protein
MSRITANQLIENGDFISAWVLRSCPGDRAGYIDYGLSESLIPLYDAFSHCKELKIH